MARIRSKPTAKAKKAFLKLEEIRHTLSGGLCHDIDEVFDRNIAQIRDVADEYAFRCRDLDYADQTAMMTADEMKRVRNHFSRWVKMTDTSPLGWSRVVRSRLNLAARRGLMSRLDLLVLELDCIVMSMFDEIFLIEDLSHSEIIKQSRDMTLYNIYNLYKKWPGGDYVPISEEFVDAIKYGLPEDPRTTGPNTSVPGWYFEKPWSQSERGSFVDKLPHQRSDTDSGIRNKARTAVAGGRQEDMADDLEAWMKRKQSHVKANARTDTSENATKATMVGLNETGVEWVMIDNPMDERTTPICLSMYGTVLRADECVPGDTAPPFHYGCRSTLVPVSDPENLGDWVEFKKSLAEFLANEKGRKK